jgi:hypothetical protein
MQQDPQETQLQVIEVLLSAPLSLNVEIQYMLFSTDHLLVAHLVVMPVLNIMQCSGTEFKNCIKFDSHANDINQLYCAITCRSKRLHTAAVGLQEVYV